MCHVRELGVFQVLEIKTRDPEWAADRSNDICSRTTLAITIEIIHSRLGVLGARLMHGAAIINGN